MFKFFALCLFAVVALAAAKPQFLAYSSSWPTAVAATPYAAAYTSGVYASPYTAAYTSGVYASPYAYSAYPYSSLYLRR
ncbi:neuropeptide-like 4 [Drosophila albomicans]|uniref:Neuropeptide-like 4 n=1 Tax=Drosophila albomicans TaxID=7291 RepID=A0A6P8YSB1_DROAB|nr:neuropeptide-like 4 [Drosophila albomicans]